MNTSTHAVPNVPNGQPVNVSRQAVYTWVRRKMLRAVKLSGTMRFYASDLDKFEKAADVARAAEVYARRQKLGEEAIAYATAIKVDAMTLLGEFLGNMEKQTGARGLPGPGRGKNGLPVGQPVLPPPTLPEQGIDHKTSSNAQALADIKKNAPTLHEQVRQGKTTVAKARQEVQKSKREKDRKEKAEAAPKATGQPTWRIIEGGPPRCTPGGRSWARKPSPTPPPSRWTR
jgi:excisionase family DNA binding protein